ncbi:MAG: rhodanese-related sulfurtransferase [Bacteroidota bacterium]|nr:rhodanese-related sulfurtransferase [Candidatus Kapabacteria bacterium]MDW8218915.1 rhodanese-related sulfurtransferase [Bacteroidota bacterium]
MTLAPMPYRVLLYYKYIPIPDFESFAAEHLTLCQAIGLLGRIIVAEEGINGTVCGTLEQTELYINEMRMDSRFEDMWFKVDETPIPAFRKLYVRAKRELVTWRFDTDIDPNTLTGTYLSPQEFRRAMLDKDVIILDGRNGYEYDLGHFEGALRPDISSSREFPVWIRQHMAQYKDRKILTYCTGGIRCEKLTGFLLSEGFRDVAQLHGGIVTYAKDPVVRGEGFIGRCYVFDDRISIPVRDDDTYKREYCATCGKPADNRVHCSWQPHCLYTPSHASL